MLGIEINVELVSSLMTVQIATIECFNQRTHQTCLEIQTHLSLTSLLWDLGKQNSPRCDAAERGVPSGAILFA